MKRIIIEGYSENPIMVNHSCISEDNMYWTGEEGMYYYDEESDEMCRLSDEFTSESDDLKYYKEIDEDDIDDDNASNVKEWCGEFYLDMTAEVNSWGFGDKVCELQYGIKSETILVSSSTYDVDINMYEVNIEYIDNIPQDYPNQNYVAIYEGINECGEKIRIEETRPFYEDSAYPECEIIKL